MGQTDIVVQGQRGSAVTDVKPIARLDGRAIAATGAATMAELLKAIAPMTKSTSGGDPIFLVNGQRTGGYQEVGTLPPEAITSVEVLPEQAALKFGYPASRTVVNVITKQHFAQIEMRAYGGGGTRGDTVTGDMFAGLTRIDGDRRVSLTGEYRHAEPLRQSQRHILPDPDNPFDAIGNVVAADGGEIDPGLSAAAGHAVTIAAVPADPAQRGTLGAYLAGADKPRSFDIGRHRTLLGGTDQVTFNGVLAMPLTKGISGTLSFSADRGADRSLQGLPAVPILVPASNAFSPFDKDVLLYRYLTEAKPLVLHTVTTKLSLGAAVRGSIGGWSWDLTGALEENRIVNRGPNLVDPGAIDQAVAGGADPFAPVGTGLLGNRIDQRSRSINRRGDTKAVVSGAPLHVPAGDVIVTATADLERATADTRAVGFTDEAIAIGRTQVEGGLTMDVPLTSRDRGVLPFAGNVSLSLSGTVRHVGGYGILSDTSYALVWAPTGTMQLIGTVKQTGAAPNMGLRSAAVVQTANVPFFDAISGQSVLVTTIAGGNPDLVAEQRASRSLNLTWQPLAGDKLFLRLIYTDETIHNQALQVTALTPSTQAAFPDLFVRDASGRLTTVLFQPINFHRERQQNLILAWNVRTELGPPPPKTADPKKPPPARPSLYFGTAFTPSLKDRLQLRDGTPVLNLLDGDTYDAAAARRRLGFEGWAGLGYKSMGVDLSATWIGGLHVQGGSPQSDLRFAPLLKLNATFFGKLDEWLPHAGWTKKTSLFLLVDNPFDTHQRVHDGTGAVPNRYQPDYLDPAGRTVKLTVRKLF